MTAEVPTHSRVKRRLIVCVAALSPLFLFWMLDPWGLFLPDNEVVPGQDEAIADLAARERNPAGFEFLAKLKLPDGDLVAFRYRYLSDSGVELQRTNKIDNVVRWHQSCPPLGVGHKSYNHEVFVVIEGDTLRVVSRGTKGTFVERLDVASGKRLARSVRKA